MRIAAARMDMEPADWCRTVIVKAAERTIEQMDI